MRELAQKLNMGWGLTLAAAMLVAAFAFFFSAAPAAAQSAMPSAVDQIDCAAAVAASTTRPVYELTEEVYDGITYHGLWLFPGETGIEPEETISVTASSGITEVVQPEWSMPMCGELAWVWMPQGSGDWRKVEVGGSVPMETVVQGWQVVEREFCADGYCPVVAPPEPGTAEWMAATMGGLPAQWTPIQGSSNWQFSARETPPNAVICAVVGSFHYGVWDPQQQKWVPAVLVDGQCTEEPIDFGTWWAPPPPPQNIFLPAIMLCEEEPAVGTPEWVAQLVGGQASQWAWDVEAEAWVFSAREIPPNAVLCAVDGVLSYAVWSPEEGGWMATELVDGACTEQAIDYALYEPYPQSPPE